MPHSDAAVLAALMEMHRWRGTDPDRIPSRLDGWSDTAQAEVRVMLAAALPHIVADEQHSIDAWDRGYRSGLSSAQKLDADCTGTSPPSRVWTLDDRRFVEESEYSQAFARGVRIGREEAVSASAPLEPVTVEGGPSDYEVWRDALGLAVQRLGGRVGNLDRDELLGVAEWFWARLDEVPMRYHGPIEDADQGDQGDEYEPDDDPESGGPF